MARHHRTSRNHRNHRINPNGNQHRASLRLLGGILVTVGAIFTMVGGFSFFSAFGGGGRPDQFWCMFVGVPMLGFGATLLKLGYMGTIARYVAGEAAPVAADTLNYVVDESRGSVRRMAAAVAEGMQEAASSEAKTIACHGCNHDNARDARFCQQCGVALQPASACPACQRAHEPGARFCSDCGTGLS